MTDKLKMVEKDGKEVPFFAADGVGKMKVGGMVEKTITPRTAQFKEMERRGYGAARQPN